MSIEELEKELAEVEKDIFYLAMKDRWDDSDYKYQDRLWKQKLNLQEELKNKGVQM